MSCGNAGPVRGIFHLQTQAQTGNAPCGATATGTRVAGCKRGAVLGSAARQQVVTNRMSVASGCDQACERHVCMAVAQALTADNRSTKHIPWPSEQPWQQAAQEPCSIVLLDTHLPLHPAAAPRHNPTTGPALAATSVPLGPLSAQLSPAAHLFQCRWSHHMCSQLSVTLRGPPPSCGCNRWVGGGGGESSSDSNNSQRANHLPFSAVLSSVIASPLHVRSELGMQPHGPVHASLSVQHVGVLEQHHVPASHSRCV